MQANAKQMVRENNTTFHASPAMGESLRTIVRKKWYIFKLFYEKERPYQASLIQKFI